MLASAVHEYCCRITPFCGLVTRTLLAFPLGRSTQSASNTIQFLANHLADTLSDRSHVPRNETGRSHTNRVRRGHIAKPARCCAAHCGRHLPRRYLIWGVVRNIYQVRSCTSEPESAVRTDNLRTVSIHVRFFLLQISLTTVHCTAVAAKRAPDFDEKQR